MRKYLSHLSLSAFLKMGKRRNEIIEKSSDEPVREPKTYRANRIASSLHPTCQNLKVERIIDENPNVKSFILVPDSESKTEKPAYFTAGQYLSITVKIGEGTYSRPYSIASAPSDCISSEDGGKSGIYMLSITKKEGGKVSPFILDNWQVGTKVKASAPLGDFVHEPIRDSRKILAIAGGSGITPFRSMIKEFVLQKGRGKSEVEEFVLLYGTQSFEDTLYLSELAGWAKECPSFKFINVLSDPNGDISLEKDEKVIFENGFITSELIKKHAPDDKCTVFVCGPQAMYDFISNEVAKLEDTFRNIRYELQSVKPEAETEVREYEIILRRNPVDALNYPDDEREITIKCMSNRTILSALEDVSAAGENHCRSGICGWCRTKLISGEVYVCPDNDGRRIADYQFGYIHPCASFPRSNLVIEK